MERFFINMKMEPNWQKACTDHAGSIHDIADYIAGFHNSMQMHSTLGNLSLNAFERKSTSTKSISLTEIS